MLLCRVLNLCLPVVLQAMFPSAEADLASSWHTIDCWTLDRSTGRRFAALNGDVNPIHMSSTLAQLFGFRSSVAHGMFVLARSIAAIENAGGVHVLCACYAWFVH